jgi:hypothetical protein
MRELVLFAAENREIFGGSPQATLGQSAGSSMARAAEAIATATHVIGSSKKPL